MANLKKLNNPCAIRKTKTLWLGEDGQNNSSFCKFFSMEYGLRACAIIIRTYVNKYRLLTVSDIINRYAPSSDGNDVKSYLNFITYYSRLLSGAQHILTPSSLVESDDDLILLVLCIAKIESSMKFNYNYVYNLLYKYDIHLSIFSTPF